MLEMIRAFIIGVGVVIVTGLFQSGHVLWGDLIIIIVLIYIFEKVINTHKATKKLFAYRIRLSVCPKWEMILPIKSKDGLVRTDNLIEEILNDPELEIDKDSLLGRRFYYTFFIDEASGVEQIWSQQYNTFVDEFEIHGHIISGRKNKIQQKYDFKDDELTNFLIINPWEIGYAHQYAPDISIDRDKILSHIPYGLIIEHIKRLRDVWSGEMEGVLKFPEELQKEFDKHGVKYETWDVEDYGTGIGFKAEPLDPKLAKYPKKAGFELSQQTMRNHIFSTKYYSISMNIKFFDRGDV